MIKMHILDGNRHDEKRILRIVNQCNVVFDPPHPRYSLKMVTGMRGNIDSVCQLTLTLWPHFGFSLTQWPFLVFWNQFLTMSEAHRMTSFWQHSVKMFNLSCFFVLFFFFSQKCVQICFLLGKLTHFFSSNSHPLTLTLLGFLTEWPPFWRKISHRKTLSFELLSENPRHFQGSNHPIHHLFGVAAEMFLYTLVQWNVIMYANVTLPLALVSNKLNVPFFFHVISMGLKLQLLSSAFLKKLCQNCQ